MRSVLMLIPILILGPAVAAQEVKPVPYVPRFGPGSHVDETSAQGVYRSAPPRIRDGRAGPPGSKMPSGQVGPACMTPLWKAGFHTNHVECPLYLATRPGASQQCTASDAAGRVRTLTVTFLDWDPATSRGSIDCRLNAR